MIQNTMKTLFWIFEKSYDNLMTILEILYDVRRS